MAPFGAPAFILASSAGVATLLLPREAAVLTGAAPEAVLEALTGVALSPADLRAALAGCVTSAPLASGLTWPDGWVSLRFADGSAGWFRKVGARWVLRVATRAGWRIEYPLWTGRFPAAVRLTAGGTDIRLEARQLETNVALDPGVFTVAVPPSSRVIGLDEIRRTGTLKESR